MEFLVGMLATFGGMLILMVPRLILNETRNTDPKLPAVVVSVLGGLSLWVAAYVWWTAGPQ